MSKLRKAAQQALEALEECVDLVRNEYATDWRHGMPTRAAQLASMREGVEAHEAAIAALRAALEAESEQRSDLYGRLESLSKSLEGSGRIDTHDDPEAYGTILDAMVALISDAPAPVGLLAGEPTTWQEAALRVGEELSSVGPDGYYDMQAETWRDWALKTLAEPAGEPEPVQPLKGWKLNHVRKHPEVEGVAEIGYLDEDDRFAPILTVDTGLYYEDAQALPLAVSVLSMLSAHPPQRTPEPAGEPVAWYFIEDPWGANEWHWMTDSPESQECDPRDWTPVYRHPPQRKPLSDGEISDLILACEDGKVDACTYHDLARAIERAHNIT
jgi:hypothetical protein